MSLVGRAVREATKSRLDPVFVWTDCPEIKSEALRYGALVPHRSPEHAGDATTTEESVQAFLKDHDGGWKAIAVIQCTTPFLKACHMTEAWNQYTGSNGKIDSVVSGVRFERYLGYPQDNKTSFIPMRPYRTLRQEGAPRLYMENGGIYLAGRHLWLQGRRIGAACGVVEMDWWESLEIDEPIDLDVARRLADLFVEEETVDPEKRVRWIWENKH